MQIIEESSKIQEKQENLEFLKKILPVLDELKNKRFVESVFVEDGSIVVAYANGFKGKIKLPSFDNNSFKDECLKHVNIKMLEQKSEILSLLKERINKVSKQEGAQGEKGDTGERGEKGERGNNIKDARIEQDGHLIIKTDDREIDAGEVSLKRFYGGIGTITYSNELSMTKKVGGLKKGTRFENVDFRVLITKLLYGYEFPFFNIFAIEQLEQIVEIGYTLPAINTKAVFEIQNTELLKEKTIRLKQDDDVLVDKMPNLPPIDITTNQKQYNTLGSSVFEISAYDTTGVSFNSYFTVSFLYKIYYGEYTEDITDTGFDNPLLVLRAKELLSDIEGEYLFLPIAYKWFCFPAMLGEHYVFYELISDVGIVMDEVRKITIKNEHSLDIEYNCYRSLNEISEEFIMGVKRG
jgi:hypothetical protein